MSGLSTTGATQLTGIDSLPHSINLWRHALSWLGGMGIIVLAVAILPLLGVGGMQLYRAGAPGTVKDAKLAPRITETARALGAVYVGLTAACALALWVAGMSPFDAICHAFSTLGLGGFSTHDANIGYFHSPMIELVIMIFMLIAAMNFTTHFMALRKGDLKLYRRDPEVRWMLLLILGSCVAIASSSTSSRSIRTSSSRCATPPSTSSRWRPTAVSSAPTTVRGRSSRRCGCCS